jgi:serine protease Do
VGWRAWVILLFWSSRAQAGSAAAVSPSSPLSDLVETARQAVVHVRAVVPDFSHSGGGTNAVLSVGSGFFVDRGGLLVTNEHVIHDAVDIRVRLFDGRELPACVAGLDLLTDIALLAVKSARPVPELAMGDSDKVRAGDPVVAIGSPFGFSHSTTAGIVSATDRVIDRAEWRGESRTTSVPNNGGYAFFIQTDALINVGNSGGPLVDQSGRVIGVNSAFWGRAQTAQGVGFAIPINIVKMLLPRLRQQGEAPRSYLGVQSQSVDSALARGLGVPTTGGALIAGVDPGSPAEAGGLEPGDVVTVWDGHSIQGAEEFKIYAQLTLPGARVRLSILRNGKQTEHVLSMRPAPEGKPALSALGCRNATPPPPLPDGFEVVEQPAGRNKGLPNNRAVRVSKVSGGAAVDAGLQVDDIILRVGRTPVGTTTELRKALGAFPASRPVPLLMRRDGADFWRALPRQ